MLKDYLALDREDEDVYYLLDNFNTRSRQRIDAVRKKVKSGEYTLLFRFGKYWFIQVKHRAKETKEKQR
jgi:5-hydroxyisourate hydrolase-like protein (transthyretin family)